MQDQNFSPPLRKIQYSLEAVESIAQLPLMDHCAHDACIIPSHLESGLMLMVHQKRARNSLVRSSARAFTTSTRRRYADVFPSQTEDPASAAILSSLEASPQVSQTLTEKVVQRHAQGLAKGQYVKAGDYVTLSPHYCMTHGTHWAQCASYFSNADDIRQLMAYCVEVHVNWSYKDP